MADVGDRRGQLILIGAVALAVVFVGLALILNSAIYTNNLASRDESVGTSEVLGIKNAAWSSGAAAIRHTNRQAYTDSYAFESSLSENLTRTTAGQQDLSARSGRSVEVGFESGSVTKGIRVAQDNGTTYDPQNTTVLDSSSFNTVYPYWRVAPQVPAMRGFRMDIDKSRLTQVTQASAETYVLNFDGSASFGSGPPFAVAYDSDTADTDPEHAVAIYQSDSDPNDVKITYGDFEAGTTTTCTIEDAPATVRIQASDQLVVGSPECREVFSYVATINTPYDMYYVQPDAIGGNYTFVVERSYSNFKSDVQSGISDEKYAFPDEDARSSPYASAAVWGADVNVTYYTDSVRYRSNTTVSPHNPDDNNP